MNTTAKPLVLRNMLIFMFALGVVGIISTILAPRADAAYQSGRIIDDEIFLDATTMKASEIQTFLVGKNSGLKDMKFTLSCYGSGSTERQLYTSAGAQCDTPIPASEIIYYAAQIYGINPKVILATMQKEQSLTTAPNPTVWQLTQAMGYACPTSGSCDSSSSFPYQIDSGTWALRYHFERARGNMSWWHQSTSWTCGTAKPSYYLPNLYPKQNVNFVDPYSGVQYATVYIENAATSAFYCYTPHVFNNHTNSPHPNEPKGSSRCYSSLPSAGDRGRCYTGSYNFVYFFEAWFGPTVGPPFAWQVVANRIYDENKYAEINTEKLRKGERVFVSLKVKNIGTEIWYRNGPNPATLATVRPYNHTSPICDTTWLNCSRATIIKEEAVYPGQEGHFEFYAVAPETLGEIRDFMAPVLENRAWMQNDTGHHTYLKSNEDLSWKWGSLSAWSDPSRTIPLDITNVSKGQYFYITLRATNTSATLWRKDGPSPVWLGSFAPKDRKSVLCAYSWPTCNRPAPMNEAIVGPGQVATFTFLARAPYQAGEYREYFKPLSEFKSWMSDDYNHIYLRVTN